MVIKYYLTKPNQESKLRLVCIFSRTEQLKFTTEHRIHPKFWDSKQQKATDKMDGSSELNLLLEELKLCVLKQFRELKLQGVTVWPIIKEKLLLYLKTGSAKGDTEQGASKSLNFDLRTMIDVFIASKTVEYKPTTVKKYKLLKSILGEFETYRNKKIKLSEISYSLLEEFRLYMLTVRNNRNDSVYIKLASLKCVLRWLLINNYPIDVKALEIRQKVKQKHDIVTLSEEELKLPHKVKLNSFQSQIRDCFLFQVYTGQRFSDMQQLNPNQITGDIWSFQSIKTGKNLLIPLVGWSKIAKDIASKYNYTFPKYTQQYFNREITKICRLAGITEQVTLKRYKGSTTIDICKSKCEMISSHTARRTCVSLLLLKGVPPTVVMKLTGHTSIQTMMKYERTSNEALFNALSVL